MKNQFKEDFFIIGILSIFFIITIGCLIVTTSKQEFYNERISGFIIGGIGWILNWLLSQRIIDKNLFRNFLFINLFIFLIVFVKQFITKFETVNLAISFLPIVYLFLLKYGSLIISEKYKNFEKPVIVYFSMTGHDWKGKRRGYKPKVIEKVFSIILQFFFALAMILIITINK